MRRGRSTLDRLSVLAGVELLAAFVIVGRLFQLQVLAPDRYRDDARAQYTTEVELSAKRGVIFDANLLPLARTSSSRTLTANPRSIDEPERLAVQLAGLGVGSRDALSRVLRSSGSYARLGTHLPVEAVVALDTLGLEGIRLERDQVRWTDDSAMHVVGIVGRDNRGLEGLELVLDADLVGTPGSVAFQRTAGGHNAVVVERLEPVRGNDVFLTLDLEIQQDAVRALRAGIARHKAAGGSVVVLEPGTGAIRAMANFPDFDPAHAGESTPDQRRNRSVTDVLEPGSAFKIVAFAAALERGLFDPVDTLDCGNGRLRIARHTIRDVHPYENLSFEDVLVQSSNVGTVRVAEAVGEESLYDYSRRFGFGQRTGIDFPGEVPGILHEPGSAAWSGLSLACLSIGQEVSCTPLQLATAFGALAAGGNLMEPRIVDRIVDPSGDLVMEARPRRIRRVVSAKTANRLTSMLIRAVEDGTGQKARIDGTRVAGKTGTAQRADPETGGYRPGSYNSTFVGFLPDHEPPLVIAVAVTEPRKGHFGNDVAAPIFRDVAASLVERESVKGPTIAVADRSPARTVPELRGLTIEQARAALRRARLDMEVQGETGWVLRQDPAPGTDVDKGDVVRVAVGGAEAPEDGEEPPGLVSMPDVTGLSLREAHRLVTEVGLRIKVQGTGNVVNQAPSAGTQMRPDARCVVWARPVTGVKS